MSITSNLQSLLMGFLSVVPKLVGALVVILIGYMISMIVRKMIATTFQKLNIDRFADPINQSDFFDKSSFKVVPSAIVSTIIYYFVFLIFIVAGTDILGMESLSQLVKDILNWIPNLITGLLLLFVGFLFADAAKSGVIKACESFGIPSGKFIGAAVFYFILVNVLISALGQAKVNTQFIGTNISIIIAGIALAFSIGYGLASKDVVANFLVSFYSKDKLVIGQKVSLEGVTGYITEIDKTSLTLDCGDKKVIIPLNKLAKEKIEIYNEKTKLID
ncbi:MAG TPA: hypothetical protein PK006_06025 [Saprospiraceae bacterium]|nr:hypothetical protein [Saprospiraceae bacterium]